MTKLDPMGLNCPMPALKMRKALKGLTPGDQLRAHRADPLAAIDIAILIRETGDRVDIAEQAKRPIAFLIEKANGAA